MKMTVTEIQAVIADLRNLIGDTASSLLDPLSSYDIPDNLDAWALKQAYDDTGALLDGNIEVSDGYHTFDELYDHRHALFGALLVLNKESAWWSEYHADGTFFKDYMIAGFEPEEGVPVTYHLPTKEWKERFKKMGILHLDKAPEWDGHTSQDVVKRLIKGFYGE